MNTVQKRDLTDHQSSFDETQQILNDAEQIIQQFSKQNSKSQHKILLFCVFPVCLFVFILFIFSTIFALLNINSTTILNGTYIHGIDVSGLTNSEAKQKITDNLSGLLNQELTLVYKDYSTTIFPVQFNASFNVDEAVETAYSIGRSGNIFENNFTIFNSFNKNTYINPSINYDVEILNSILTEIGTSIPDLVENPTYYIDGTTLVIVNGKDGIILNTDSLKNEIVENLDSENESITIEIPVIPTQADAINIDEIYKDVYKEPVDAYYTTNPYALYPSSTGLDFKISIDEAKELISTYQEEYSIPLNVLYPTVSTNDIGTEAFPDILSEFSTSFSSSTYNRATNISLAASKINGVVIMPGESFSYNQTVGKRTTAAGFKEAPAYSNGEVVQEVGGGICQVSSTLYNAVLYANLEINERLSHSFKPSYVKPGLDATVSWGGPDFKFTNNRNYPIKIVCDSSGRTLRVYLYGLKTENDYTVELRADYLSTVYPKTVYQTDSSLASGVTKVIQSGSNGCKTATYKILYDLNGNHISTECISRDTYNAHNKIIAVGP